MSIELITRDDGTRAIKLVNHSKQYGGVINSTTDIHEFTLGALDGGFATVNYPNEHGFNRDETIPMTEAEHADITEFKKVTEVSRVAGEPHTSPKPLSERFGILTNLVTGLLGRVEKLEAEDDTVYTKWVVRGTEFQCETDNRDDGYASVDLANGFIGKSHPISPNDDSDSSQLLRIKTPLGVLTIKTAVLELGKVRDAVNNGSNEAVHSAPHPTT